MATAQNIDFTNVKDGGNFNKARIPAGDYLAKITKIEDAEAKDKTFQYLVSIKLVKRSASVFPYYCKLQENQLWKLRNLLIAGGLNVPKRRTKVDPNRLLNKLIGVSIEDTEYEGKDQSEIVAVFPAAELAEGGDAAVDGDDDEGEDGEEEEPEYGSPEDEVEEEAEEEAVEDEVEEDEDPYADLDRAALKAELKKRDPAFVAKKSQTDDDLRDLLRAGDGEAEEPDEEEEVEEEEPEPVTKKVTRKPAATKARRKPATEVTDDELEELDIDDI